MRARNQRRYRNDAYVHRSQLQAYERAYQQRLRDIAALEEIAATPFYPIPQGADIDAVLVAPPRLKPRVVPKKLANPNGRGLDRSPHWPFDVNKVIDNPVYAAKVRAAINDASYASNWRYVARGTLKQIEDQIFLFYSSSIKSISTLLLLLPAPRAAAVFVVPLLFLDLPFD